MAERLRFDGQVVVITGAGSGLGRAYALLFASRGAKVVVNDLGGGINGDGSPKSSAADAVVHEITRAGGVAKADYNNVINGAAIIQTAVQAFGTVHVLINNAGILRDVSFRNMKDRDWNLIQEVHMFGTYTTTRAAWDIMKRQKYGRVLCTASAAGIYGSFGQVNYAAAKAAIIGFATSMAKEGAAHNIKVNVLAPAAASRLTATVMSPDLLAKLTPEWVAPVVGALAYESSNETGGVFDIGAGCVSKFRLERGLATNLEGNYRPQNVASAWRKITGQRPIAPLEGNSSVYNPTTRGDNAIVVNIGAVPDFSCLLQLTEIGFQVMFTSQSWSEAQAIERRVQTAGGKAVVDFSGLDRPEKTVDHAIKKFGSVQTLIVACTAEQSAELSEQQWQQRYHARLTTIYKVIKAFWPVFLKQKYGRVVIVDFDTCIEGRAGRSTESAVAMGCTGLARTLAREGEKYNILVNLVTSTSNSSSKAPAALATALSTDALGPKVTNNIFSVQGDNIALCRWQRSCGYSFPVSQPLSIEDVVGKWSEIIDFADPEYPNDSQEGMAKLLRNVGLAKAYQPKQLEAKKVAAKI